MNIANHLLSLRFLVPSLWKCFELLDLQLQQQHLITRNRDETIRSRGLGTNAPLWQRLRASCPRTVFYNGPILDGAGNQCQTDLDLSAAMLATRKFWFQPPVTYDPEWTDYPSPGHMSPHPARKTSSELSLPPTILPQVQTEYPMQHGDSTLGYHLMR